MTTGFTYLSRQRVCGSDVWAERGAGLPQLGAGQLGRVLVRRLNGRRTPLSAEATSFWLCNAWHLVASAPATHRAREASKFSLLDLLLKDLLD